MLNEGIPSRRESGTMANVTDFETAYGEAIEALLLKTNNSLENALDTLASIEDTKRPKFYRELSRSQIADDCERAVVVIKEKLDIEHVQIREYIPGGLKDTNCVYLRRSRNNKIGSDFDFFFPKIAVPMRCSAAEQSLTSVVAVSFPYMR